MSSPAIAPHPAVAGRSLLTLRHHPPDAVVAILDLADRLRPNAPRAGRRCSPGAWWRWSSSGPPRARASRSPAASPGSRARASCSRPRTCSSAAGRPSEDTAKVLGRMVDAIVLRTGPHATLEELDRNAGVPVINGLTHEHHPCQALADAQTLRERFDDLSGLPGRLPGRRQQLLRLADDRRRADGHAGHGRLPRGLPARPRGGRLGRRDGPRARRLGNGRRGSVGGGHRRTRPLHRHLGLDGRRGHGGGPHRRARALQGQRRADGRGGARRGGAPLPPRPTTATRSRPRSSTGRARPSGIRRRTACMPRRPSSPTSSGSRTRGGGATVPG